MLRCGVVLSWGVLWYMARIRLNRYVYRHLPAILYQLQLRNRMGVPDDAWLDKMANLVFSCQIFTITTSCILLMHKCNDE